MITNPATEAALGPVAYPAKPMFVVRGQYGLGKPVVSSDPVNMRLGEPISRSFEWADYHEAPGPVISPRIASVLAPLDIYGVDFVLAKVRDTTNPSATHHDYWFMHVWNHIYCLDRASSENQTAKAMFL